LGIIKDDHLLEKKAARKLKKLFKKYPNNIGFRFVNGSSTGDIQKYFNGGEVGTGVVAKAPRVFTDDDLKPYLAESLGRLFTYLSGKRTKSY
jgi:hypothetical protein